MTDGSKKYRFLMRRHPKAILCTDGKWVDRDDFRVGVTIPRRFTTGAGAANVQRSLQFSTDVEWAEYGQDLIL